MPRTSASPSRSHNLPALLSSFVGRRGEIAEVRRLLRTQRLVTLTGPGGCGKTRLALQAASDALPEFEDGAWLIEFGSLADPTLVPQTATSALGVREQSGRPLADTLADYLRARHILLILDNCEHLAGACAQFATTLLQACPTLTILATSREPLAVDGETVWMVPPLSLPGMPLTKDGARGDAPLGGQQQSEAVQLFLARAEAASPGFKLTAENATAVEDICRRLDGLPLAIELAAARLRAFTVHQVEEHLDDRFHLLTGGNRMAPERQQTLEATLDWSYALLSETERKVLERLSVFAGGCTLQSAEAVCSGDDIDIAEVLDALTRLVDKSLLLAREQDEGGMRYRLLETIRQYAHRRLLESGESPAVQSRHAETCLALATRAVRTESRFFWPAQLANIDHLEIEHDNLRSALASSQMRAPDVELGLRLASTLAQFWQMRGYMKEGIGWLDALLAEAGHASAEARAEALSAAGYLRIYADELEAGTASLEESMALYEGLQDASGVAWQLTWLGWATLAQGQYPQASSLALRAVDMHHKLGDDLGAAVALAPMGEAAYLQGEFEQAKSKFEESLALARAAGNQSTVGRRFTRLGQTMLARGDTSEAAALLEQGLTTCRDAGDYSGVTMALAACASLAVKEGHTIWACKMLGAVANMRERSGAPLWFIDRLEYEHSLEGVRSKLDASVFAAAWAEGRSMTLQQAVEHAQTKPGTAATRLSLKEEFGGLTEREREVAAWIAQGKSNREISEAMTVGVRTVETYVTRILNKLGFDSRVQIATWAVEKGPKTSKQH